MASPKSTSRSKKSKKPPKAPKDPRFDFVPGYQKGVMVPLHNEKKHQVRCTEWPESLLAMLRAGVLRGEALEYAESLDQGREEGSKATGPVRPDTPAIPNNGIPAERVV